MDPARAADLGRWVTARIVWTGGLFLIAVLVLSMCALGAGTWQEKLRSEEHDAAVLARVFEDNAGQALNIAVARLEALARVLEEEGPQARMAQGLSLRHSLGGLPFLRSLSVLDPRGRVIASSYPENAGVLVDLRQLAESRADNAPAAGVVKGRDLGDLAVGAPAPPPGHNTMLPMARHVHTRVGDFTVVAVLNPDALVLFQRMTMGDPRDGAALLSWNGQVILATEGFGAAAGQRLSGHPVFQQDGRAMHDHGNYVGPGVDGRRSITAYRWSDAHPFVVVVQASHERAFAEWWRPTRWLAGVTTALVTLIVATMLAASRGLRQQQAMTERLDATQAQVARAEQELRLLVQTMQEGLFRADDEGRMTFVNARLADWCGLPANELVGAPLWSLLVEEERDSMQAMMSEPELLPSSGMQVILGTPTSSLRAELNITMLRRPDGQPDGCVGTIVDVSERESVREALQHQLALAARLLEVTPRPIFVKDTNDRFTLVNDAWVEFFGVSRDEALGERAEVIFPCSQYKNLHRMHDRQLISHGGEVSYECVLARPSGAAVDAVMSKAALTGEDGRPTGIVGSLMDITKFRSAERAVSEARDAAEATSRLKTEFIANVSHELRTPLQVILGYSELGVMRTADAQRAKAMFRDIHKAGEGMLALVNDLLDLSKMEVALGTVDGTFEDVIALMKSVIEEMRELAHARHVRLVSVEHLTSLSLRVDGFRLQQVLRNVLANAIRFAPARSAVTIDWQDDGGGGLRASVSDEGPGIPSTEFESIFDAFVQSSRTKSGAGGTGLGLAICRKIMSAHGGRIWAANSSGGGAVFHIELPATPEPPLAVEA